jgi:hypothetical protein
MLSVRLLLRPSERRHYIQPWQSKKSAWARPVQVEVIELPSSACGNPSAREIEAAWKKRPEHREELPPARRWPPSA